MDKAQALNSFFSGFGLQAYDSQTVPSDAVLPYITYDTITDSFDNRINLTCSLWYRSTSWKEITQKASEISEEIGYGGTVVKIDDGYLWLLRGTPFAQRMSDPDDSIRRILLQVQADFLTAN